MKILKAIAGWVAGVSLFVTIASSFLMGLLVLWAYFQWVGLVFGVLLWPVTSILGLGAVMFNSVGSFFSWVFWFVFIALLYHFADAD